MILRVVPLANTPRRESRTLMEEKLPLGTSLDGSRKPSEGPTPWDNGTEKPPGRCRFGCPQNGFKTPLDEVQIFSHLFRQAPTKRLLPLGWLCW